LTQDTADANYMLLTVVVNGRNCIALQWQRTATQQNMPQARFA